MLLVYLLVFIYLFKNKATFFFFNLLVYINFRLILLTFEIFILNCSPPTTLANSGRCIIGKRGGGVSYFLAKAINVAQDIKQNDNPHQEIETETVKRRCVNCALRWRRLVAKRRTTPDPR